MRFRSQASADMAIRVGFFVGIAIAITGIVNLQAHAALGITLAAVGFVVAGALPAWVSGPAAASEPSDERKPKERAETR